MHVHTTPSLHSISEGTTVQSSVLTPLISGLPTTAVNPQITFGAVGIH